MQEQDRLAMGPDLGLAIAQHPRPARLQPVARRQDVLDLVADMVDAAGRVAGEEGGDGRVGAQRLQQLDLGIGQGRRRRR